MNCNKIERWILLEDQPCLRGGDSGPTDGQDANQPDSRRFSRRQQLIAGHLAHCVTCRQWLDGYRRVAELATDPILSKGDPSPSVLVNIHREARVRAPEPGRQSDATIGRFGARLLRASALRPSFGLATVAALCLLIVGGWLLRPAPETLAGEARLGIILRMVAEETDSGMPDESGTTDAERTSSVEALAQELLTLQGLDAGYTELELTTPGGALQATDPLTHSTGVSRSGIYG